LFNQSSPSPIACDYIPFIKEKSSQCGVGVALAGLIHGVAEGVLIGEVVEDIKKSWGGSQ
jgi:hypothetical protein